MYDKEDILKMIEFQYTDWSKAEGAPYQCQGPQRNWKYDVSQVTK